MLYAEFAAHVAKHHEQLVQRGVEDLGAAAMHLVDENVAFGIVGYSKNRAGGIDTAFDAFSAEIQDLSQVSAHIASRNDRGLAVVREARFVSPGPYAEQNGTYLKTAFLKGNPGWSQNEFYCPPVDQNGAHVLHFSLSRGVFSSLVDDKHLGWVNNTLPRQV